MTDSSAQSRRDQIDPVVLTGGMSRRFGRDKLRERLDDGGMLIDRPVAALRAVFGPRVAIVGACDPLVRTRADRVIDDPYPGVGPIGGIVAALQDSPRDVFVLAGDLPAIEPAHIRQILGVARLSPGAHAVLGRTDRLEPLIGLYRRACLPVLLQRLERGERSLHDAIAAVHRRDVPLASEAAQNINTTVDWRRRFGRR